MDATELAEFYTHREDTYNGKAIADMAGGANKATMLMDTNHDRKVSADEFFAHVNPRYQKAIAEEDFAAADSDHNGSLNLEEYKNSNYGMERVPGLDAHEGFEGHFKELDENSDGKINKEEYIEKAGQDHFMLMDADHDEVVTYPEFRQHKHNHYHVEGTEPVTAESDNTKAAFDQLDLNHDGKITRSEEVFALMPDSEEVQRSLTQSDQKDDNDGDHDAGAED